MFFHGFWNFGKCGEWFRPRLSGPWVWVGASLWTKLLSRILYWVLFSKNIDTELLANKLKITLLTHGAMWGLDSPRHRRCLSYDFQSIFNFDFWFWSITLKRLPCRRVGNFFFLDDTTHVLWKLLKLDLSHFLVLGSILFDYLSLASGLRLAVWTSRSPSSFPNPGSIPHVVPHGWVRAGTRLYFLLVLIILRNLQATWDVIKVEVQLYIFWIQDIEVFIH